MQLRWRIAQFFEFYWWRFYLAKKQKDDYLLWKKNYWRAFFQNNGLQFPPDISVLDVGCGPAGAFIILDQQQVHALDPLIDRYAQSFPHFSPNDYPRVQFYNQTLEQYFPQIKYDMVLALNAINHVADLEVCFRRLAALLKPGGLLVLSVDVHNYAWLKHIFQIAPGDILHPQQYTLADYRKMLDKQGLLVHQTVLLRKELIFSYYLLTVKMLPNG